MSDEDKSDVNWASDETDAPDNDEVDITKFEEISNGEEVLFKDGIASEDIVSEGRSETCEGVTEGELEDRLKVDVGSKGRAAPDVSIDGGMEDRAVSGDDVTAEDISGASELVTIDMEEAKNGAEEDAFEASPDDWNMSVVEIVPGMEDACDYSEVAIEDGAPDKESGMLTDALAEFVCGSKLTPVETKVDV